MPASTCAYEDVGHDLPLLAGMEESCVSRRAEGECLLCTELVYLLPSCAAAVQSAHGGQGASGASYAVCAAGLMGCSVMSRHAV